MTPPYDDLLASGVRADVRPAHPVRDVVDGRTAGAVVVPHDAAAVAAVLGWASERHLSVVIRGAGTKLGWGRPPATLDVILDMGRLDRLVAHQQGDLTATVEAGVSLGELNRGLAAHGQWLPLDPPFAEAATIGGILATNDSGPLRHRYGTPRDLVIGIQLATTGGQLARAGGQVVKNVAGYDLSKIVSGSFGGLAAVVAATFKLSPLPQASRTVVVRQLDTASLGEVVQRLGDAALDPAAFDVHVTAGAPGPSATCMIRFASVAEAVDAQVAEAGAIIGSAASCDVLAGEAERELWQQHAARVWQQAGAIVRGSWLPADLAAAIRLLEQRAFGCSMELVGRAGVGAGLIRIDAATERQADVIEQLRASKTVGNVVIVRASAELKTRIDVWPPMPHVGLLSSVKRALDPHNVLGAGRGPL